ncbi:MAG TPA: hypothetical protein VHT31_05355, partial [Candidatus Acidoferrum sp.]|nr:hypothetical protein [Candidatus Acidoferrum sp.]
RVSRLAAESREPADDLTGEIRTMSYLLHPPLLDESGLASALQWYVDAFSQRSKITVELESAGAVAGGRFQRRRRNLAQRRYLISSPANGVHNLRHIRKRTPRQYRFSKPCSCGIIMRRKI